MPPSAVEKIAAKMERELEERRLLEPAPPWPATERTDAKRKARRKRAREFWPFRELYFPDEMYAGGYFAPCSMHEAIVAHATKPGVHIEAGPRDHGKTVTGITRVVHMLLTGEAYVVATYSHSVFPTSSNLLTTITTLIDDNPRIMEDYGIEWIEKTKEQAQFRVRGEREVRVIGAFSEGKSVRGFSKNFRRPDIILGDDIETASSPMSEEQVEQRIVKVAEAYLSLGSDGVFLWFGNNFDEGCAINRLLKRQDLGELDDHWHVHVYDAWNDETNAPLWPERFPATSAAELRAMLRPFDDADWWGNFRQRPRKRAGDIFPEACYAEWIEIPRDALGVMFCDPNLSLKDKGDTTAFGAALFSPSTQLYYLRDLHCQSYSDPNDLLDAYLSIKQTDIVRVGFDGNVSQEAQWTNHVYNWSRNRNRPAPWIEYRHYHVDLLTKNTESLYKGKRLRFPPGFKQTMHGRAFMAQVHAFRGKRVGRKDDAPDFLISVCELIHEAGIVKLPSDGKPQVYSTPESPMF